MAIAESIKPVSKPHPTLFLQKFLRHGTTIASVAPSSRTLANALCDALDPTRPQVILELGAGTGAVTSVALERMHPDSRLFAVERDSTFAKHLRDLCPSAHVLHTDVSHVDGMLHDMNIHNVDVILNCLPTPSLPYSVNRGVFDCISRVGKDAVTAQLTVIPWIFKAFYSRLYEEVEFKLVMANIPPGGVYFCRNLRENYAEFLPRKS